MIVVTGATGFLGSAIVRALALRGDKVRALVREGSGQTTRDEFAALGVEEVTGDVLSRGSLSRAMDGAHAVIHCAGKLGRAGAVLSDYLHIHADGTRNVLAAARSAGVSRFMHLSSPGLLGPIHGADADEDAPFNPTNVYERAKAASETAVHDFQCDHGPFAVVVRPEFVYGAGDLHVLRLFQSIQRGRFFYIGPGTALCHPTYVDDAVRGMLAAFDRGQLGRVYHLAGPRPITIRELAESFASALNVSPPRFHVPEGMVRVALRGLRPLANILRRPLPIDESGVDFFTFDRHFSCQRAKNELDFVPEIDITVGARKAVAWYKEHQLL